MYTTKQIFEGNQILTLSVLGQLIGKTIECTNPEYSANTPDVTTIKVAGFISEWDAAALDAYPDQKGKFPQYENFQQYWASYFTKERIILAKRTYRIVGDTGMKFFKCEIDNGYFPEPTFFGSDADREVYYLISE